MVATRNKEFFVTKKGIPKKDRFWKSLRRLVLVLCCPCPPRGPENSRNSSRSKVGPEVGYGGSLK